MNHRPEGTFHVLNFSEPPKRRKLGNLARSGATITPLRSSSKRDIKKATPIYPESVRRAEQKGSTLAVTVLREGGMLLEIDFKKKELIARTDYDLLPPEEQKVSFSKQQRAEATAHQRSEEEPEKPNENEPEKVPHQSRIKKRIAALANTLSKRADKDY